VALETEINTGIANLMQLKQEIGESIRSINSMECETLLEMRYLTFLGWNQIAHLHRKALSLVKVPET